MSFIEILMYAFQFLIALITINLVFMIHKQHKEYCEILETASDLLGEMQRHEHKINILMNNLESRHDRILKEEENAAE